MTYETFLFKQLETRADRLIKEESDPQDTVTMDVPLLIRLLELAREDVKDDADLHRVVDRVLAIKNRGTLTMDDYAEIEGTPDEPTEKPAPATGLDEIRKLAGLK